MNKGNKLYSQIMYILLPYLCLIIPSYINAAESDSISIPQKKIEEIVVIGNLNEGIKQADNGELRWNMKSINENVRIMGEADPLRYLQMLPGVQTGQDYATGISVQGCDFSQTLITMDGAPIFYPYHLFGVFSACNADHFKSMNIEKSIHDGRFNNRLGGLVEMQSYNNIVDKLSCKINVGLISSNISLSAPINNKISVYASGRLSYLNLLYNSFMSDSLTENKYNFFDTNLTMVYAPNDHNKVIFNGYFGKDVLSINEKLTTLDTRLGWNNGAISGVWQHDGKLQVKQKLYFSWFTNYFNLEMPQVWIRVPSSIKEYGYQGDFSIPLNNKLGAIQCGLYGALRYITPQSATIDGYVGSFNNSNNEEQSLETKCYAQWRVDITPKWNLTLGLKGTYYHTNSDFSQINADPFFTTNYQCGNNKFTFHYGVYNQYMHQVGFSDEGFPTNFWINSDRETLPQQAQAFTLAYNRDFAQKQYSISSEIYYKHIKNDVEYSSYVFKMLQSDYNYREHLIYGNGYNMGVDLMLKRNYGRITGWVSYSLGYSRRLFPKKSDKYVPSSRESLHSLSLLINYRLAKKWNVSANFVFASGAPTTLMKSIYMIGENYINEYGDWHSSRLPAYHRLDLSANYKFKGKIAGYILHQTINLSIVNAYAHKNIFMRYFRYKQDEDTKETRFILENKSSLYKIMPSVSYSIEF